MGFYEESLKQLKTNKLAIEGKVIYYKSIISIMETIKNGLGNDHDGNSIYGKFDPVAVQNIIDINNLYVQACEQKIEDISKKIKKCESKLENGSKSCEFVDELFSSVLDQYKDFENKDIFDLLNDLED